MGSSSAADAEAAALAVTIFNQVGVSGFKLDLGHTGYIQGVLSECPTQPVRERIWQLLRKKDLVGLKAAVMTGDLPEHVRVLLLNLPHARGGAKLLEEAYAGAPNEMARNAAANLREIYARLHDYGLGAQTEIDLGMVKSFGYYTGMVLEGYVPQVGFTLCSGGRYDQLGMGFGSHLPAVGFALGLERLMLALELQGLRPEAKSGGVLILPRSWPHALNMPLVCGIRESGLRWIQKTGPKPKRRHMPVSASLPGWWLWMQHPSESCPLMERRARSAENRRGQGKASGLVFGAAGTSRL